MAQTHDWQDVDFASDVTAAKLQGPSPKSRILLIFVLLFFVAAFIWAKSATI